MKRVQKSGNQSSFKPKTKSQFKSKIDVSLEPALAELRRIYTSSLSRFGDLGMKPIPMIAVQSRGRKRILGWFAPERWEKTGGDKPFNEITIAAESLARPIEEIAATLLSLMVQSACHYAGVKAVSNGYHNGKFKAAAESIGLVAEKDERLGWCRTSLGSELKDFVSSLNVNDAAFAVFRIPPKDLTKQPTKMKKWACACTILRCATKVTGVCTTCDEPYEWAEKEPNPWADQQAPDKSFGLNGEDKDEDLVELRSSEPKKPEGKARKKDKQKKGKRASMGRMGTEVRQ